MSWLAGPTSVDAPLLLARLPSEVPFGFLGRLLPTSVPAELRMQIHRIPGGHALEILDRAHAVAEAELASGAASEDARPVELAREVDTTEDVARRVAAREQELWRVGVAVHALAPGPERADRMRSDLLRRFRAAGFRPRVPTYEAAAAVGPPDLGGTEPRPAGYWHTLPTDGAAAFFPFLDEGVQEPGGILVGVLLDDATPILLNRWGHASYSWGVFGATGSGKTFFTALTVLRTLWMRPELDVVFLDPLGEFAGFVDRLGGDVIDVTTAERRFNPLDPASTGGNRAEKAGRVAAVFRALFPSLRDEEGATLDAALHRLYSDGPAVPVLSDLVDEVDRSVGATDRLRTLLEVFRTGSLSHLDGPTNIDWAEGPIAIRLTGVPENQLPFHLAYLADAVHARLRSRPGPKLLVIDEAHRLTGDPGTARFLERLVREVRHFDAGLLLVSQDPHDFLGSEPGRAVLRNLRATFFLRLAEVSDATREFFGLTAAEAEWLPRARLPKESGYAEALLRSGPAHLPIGLLASTPEYELLTGALGATERRRAAPSDVRIEP